METFDHGPCAFVVLVGGDDPKVGGQLEEFFKETLDNESSTFKSVQWESPEFCLLLWYTIGGDGAVELVGVEFPRNRVIEDDAKTFVKTNLEHLRNKLWDAAGREGPAPGKRLRIQRELMNVGSFN
uniref:Uncharacterized protein n=1 Tax=Chromera velia CCMP2878 TaxID=1169474 RepID=A0A0G4HE74_9ALVE|mmetsp:Transcript_36063/g.70973  ORF Transcript_36063/g.70973 Transcript_36063/m.70973 type:complete len:126 (-) Transcript_36063:74-451(-)|eukprot:Cvel_6514.t1-p1 / transcript=Cvel_6514.t1 / gene=Cvel_6514 / organism=Chromera_velia_CCMP2878 / gene_product=hypothetical protein / transcript_product=hypothetical protein / location=Cvel_scaffold320:49896-51446(+) / protein_length=125 / sequence_SO=supercontig / SO=protein_coding / is_pseudo=false